MNILNIKSTKSILDYSDNDLMKLSKTEIDSLLNDATYRAENRRKRAYNAITKKYGDEVTPPQAYRSNFDFATPISKEGFNTKNQKIKRIKQLQGLLSAGTSTAQGFYKSISRLSKHFKQETGLTLKNIMINDDLSKRFWRVLSAVQNRTRGTDYRYKSVEDEKKGYNKKLIELAVKEISKHDDWKNEMLKGSNQSLENDLFAQEIIRALESKISGAYEEELLQEEKANKRQNQKTRLSRSLD